MISVVQQNVFIFNASIRDNITMFSDFSGEEVDRAIELSGLSKLVAERGEDYLCGENGSGLSGGEKQRISIARAVLKSPSILIFDEATAAVDSETEHLIQEAIDRLIAGKTTIMIAHRLSTLRRANRIIVVDGGKIIENGSPEELMAMKGKYYKLVQIQSMTADADRMREEERL